MSTENHKSQRSEAKNSMVVRVAYPFFHEKRTKRANGADLKKPRYDGTLLVPKLNADPTQCANYQALAAHCIEAATKAWGSWPQGGHWPIQDGDAPPKPKAPVPGQPAAEPKDYPWRKGHWLIEVTNYMDPGPRIAIMQNGQPVEIPARVINGQTMYKSGDFFIVNMSAYTFHNEKFGVNFGFDGALWVREGEAIGSSGPRSAAQMFGQVQGVPSQAPQAAMPVPQTAAPAAPVMPVPQAAAMVHQAPPVPTAAPVAPVPQAVAPAAPMPGQAPMPTLPPMPGVAPVPAGIPGPR